MMMNAQSSETSSPSASEPANYTPDTEALREHEGSKKFRPMECPMTQETIEDGTRVTPLGEPELPSLSELILLGWKRIYSFRSPAGHKYAVHINGPTIANIHLETGEAVITYNQATQKPEYINPAKLQTF